MGRSVKVNPRFDEKGVDKGFKLLVVAPHLATLFLDAWWEASPGTYLEIYDRYTEHSDKITGIILIQDLSENYPGVFNRVWKTVPPHKWSDVGIMRGVTSKNVKF